MWFETSLVIPKSQTKAAPAKVILPICSGVIHRVAIEAAPGCHREAGIRILYNEFQLYPLNASGWIRLDAAPRNFETREEIFQPAFELKIEGYNTDAKNNHEYIIGVGIMAPEVFPEYRETEGLIKKIARILGIK